MMNSNTYQAFGDELTKIAMANTIMKGFKSALREGWGPAKGGVMGTSRIGKYLPIGPKALTVGTTAMMLPGALAPADPSGQGRSTTERMMDVGGSTVGGLAGAGAGTMLARKLAPKSGALGTALSLAGGIAGGIGGGRALTSPWRDSRRSLIHHMQTGQVAPEALAVEGAG